jgi:hypothetical protein
METVRAAPGRLFLSLVLDAALWAAPPGILGPMALAPFHNSRGSGGDGGNGLAVALVLLLAAGGSVLLWGGIFLLQLWMLGSRRRTFGMMLAGIRFVRADGSAAPGLLAMGRAAFIVLCPLFAVLYAIAAAAAAATADVQAEPAKQLIAYLVAAAASFLLIASYLPLLDGYRRTLADALCGTVASRPPLVAVHEGR